MNNIMVEELEMVVAPVTAQDTFDFLTGVAVGITIAAFFLGC